MESPAEQTLPWTNCWRKVYAEAAKALGYGCCWWGGQLAITKNGVLIDFITPERTFRMSELIEQAKANKSKKEQEKAEARARQAKLPANTFLYKNPQSRSGIRTGLLLAGMAAALIPPATPKQS